MSVTQLKKHWIYGGKVEFDSHKNTIFRREKKL